MSHICRDSRSLHIFSYWLPAALPRFPLRAHHHSLGLLAPGMLPVCISPGPCPSAPDTRGDRTALCSMAIPSPAPATGQPHHPAKHWRQEEARSSVSCRLCSHVAWKKSERGVFFVVTHTAPSSLCSIVYLACIKHFILENERWRWNMELPQLLQQP